MKLTLSAIFNLKTELSSKMALSYRGKVLKNILLFMNGFLFFLSLSGIVSSYFKNRSEEVVFKHVKQLAVTPDPYLSDYRLSDSSYLVISSSIVMIILSILGYCGVLKELKFLIGVHVLSLVIILTLVFSALVLDLLKTSSFDNTLRDDLKNIFRNATLNSSLENRVMMFQQFIKCCINNGTANSTNSCNDFHLDCYEKISRMLTSNNALLSIFTFLMSIIQIAELLLLCSFLYALRVH
ncbi:hypothetical protein Ahia01_000247600 [Argonauta hians]